MKRIVCDVEANGLLNKLTHLWCAVTTDIDTEETLVFSDYSKDADGGMKEFIAHLDTCDEIIGHNFIGYDVQAIDLALNYKIKATVIDTFLMSKLLKFNRLTPKGARTNHSLEAWGLRLKIAKPSQEQWDVWEESMLHRCKEDVRINVALYKVLLKEVEGQPKVKQALAIEHDVAWITAEQVKNGWLLDQNKVRENLEHLDSEISRLRNQLEPLIPSRCIPKDKKATWEETNEAMGGFWKKVPMTRMDHRQKPVKPTYLPKQVKILADGRYDKHTANWFGIEQEDAWGSRELHPGAYYCRIEFKAVKLSQHAHVKAFLLTIGWIPTEWNYKKDQFGKFLKDHENKFLKASPKLTPDSFDSIPGNFGEDFKLWATLTHRRTTLANPKNDTKGWLNIMREDGHVVCDPDTLGAATGRMIHRGIVNVPGVKSIFGKEMRQCWIAEEGRKLIGADAAGAQLRLLAANMNDEDYLNIVVHGQEEDEEGNFKGTDVHTQNGIAAGLLKETTLVWLREHSPDHPDWEKHHELFVQGRARSKTFIYALLFGGGAAKLGSIVGGGIKEGTQLKKKFFEGFPKLGILMRRLEAEYEGNKKSHKEGFITGLDGRRVYVDSPHKILNYKLQGDEAIFVKYTMVLIDKLFRKNNIDAKLLLVMHDEANYSINPDDIERAKVILKHSFIKAGEYLGLLCQMQTNPLVGDNWAEIH